MVLEYDPGYPQHPVEMQCRQQDSSDQEFVCEGFCKLTVQCTSHANCQVHLFLLR